MFVTKSNTYRCITRKNFIFLPSRIFYLMAWLHVGERRRKIFGTRNFRGAKFHRKSRKLQIATKKKKNEEWVRATKFSAFHYCCIVRVKLKKMLFFEFSTCSTKPACNKRFSREWHLETCPGPHVLIIEKWILALSVLQTSLLLPLNL